MPDVVEFRIHDDVNSEMVRRMLEPVLADPKQRLKPGRVVELRTGARLNDLRSRLIRVGVLQQ